MDEEVGKIKSVNREAIEPKVHQHKHIQKDQWGNDIEFLLSCITLSVGLGNIWRFPFTALEYGGGTFLIPYTIMTFLVGKPFYYMEVILGQFSSRGCIKVFNISPAIRGVGVGQIFCSFIVLSIYVSVMALTIHYFMASFEKPLPWVVCKAAWNTSCVDSRLKNVIFAGNRPRSSAELYFVKEVLKETDSIENGIGWPDKTLLICLAASWLVIGLVLIRGIKSSGKAAYFLAIFPYVVLMILLVRSATLEGAADGMLYFITPEWDKLFEAKLWYAAVTQVFYALNVCFGTLVMYSSYNRFDQNITRDCHFISVMDYSSSVLAGLIIFGLIGHLAHIMKVDIQDVTKSYMGLAFIAYPETIAKFELMPQFFSFVFFFMLFLFCIGSNMGMAMSVMTVIRDEYPTIKCWKIVVGIMIVGFALSSVYTTPGGQWIINMLDFYGASFVSMVFAIIELVTVGWIYGVDRFCNDIEFMLCRKTGLYWRLCWKFITPTTMIGVFVYFLATWKPLTYHDREYPAFWNSIGWGVCCFALLQLPIWALYAIVKAPCACLCTMIVSAFKPSDNWGPNDDDAFELYKDFNKTFEKASEEEEDE